MFTADQLIDATLAALKNRGVSVDRRRLSCVPFHNHQACTFGVTDDFAIVPSEGEWQRWTSGVESPPPLPLARYRFFAFAQPVMAAVEGGPEIHVIALLLDVKVDDVLRRSLGRGAKTQAGLNQAMAEAIQCLTVMFFPKTRWHELAARSV